MSQIYLEPDHRNYFSEYILILLHEFTFPGPATLHLEVDKYFGCNFTDWVTAYQSDSFI